MAFAELFSTNEDSGTASVAVLCVRILAGVTLFAQSGLPRLEHLSAALSARGDAGFFGLYGTASEVFATVALGLATLLVAVGLATRWAALVVTLSLAGTFFLVDHVLTLNLLDPGHNSHPEVIWLYMTMFAVLIFTGAGRFSCDRWLQR